MAPFTAGQILTAGQLGDGRNSYNPVLHASTTDPNLGADGTISGLYYRILPDIILVQVQLQFLGVGVSAGNGSYQITLPTPFSTVYGAGSPAQVVGAGIIRDDDVPANRQPVAVGVFAGVGGPSMLLQPHGASFVTHNDPFTWATGDRIHFSAMYFIDA